MLYFVERRKSRVEVGCNIAFSKYFFCRGAALFTGQCLMMKAVKSWYGKSTARQDILSSSFYPVD